jgi:hypothetical protein
LHVDEVRWPVHSAGGMRVGKADVVVVNAHVLAVDPVRTSK